MVNGQQHHDFNTMKKGPHTSRWAHIPSANPRSLPIAHGLNERDAVFSFHRDWG